MPTTDEPRGWIERRGGPRVTTTGSVVVGPAGTRGRVHDLSTSGVRLQLGPGESCGAVGDRVTLDLRLDGASPGWFRFVGRIVRVAAGGVVAVAFDVVPRELVSMVRGELLEVLASDATPRVVVVDPVADRRVLVAAALRAAGCRVREAATPLEVIGQLEESQHPWVIAVADTVPAGRGDELRRYLGAAHGKILLVSISEHAGDEVTEQTRLAVDDAPGLEARVARLVATRID